MKKHDSDSHLSAGEICFGLDRTTDERSITAFIERFARPEVLAALTPRLEENEIHAILDFLSNLMHKHFSEQEYHRLFLGPLK